MRIETITIVSKLKKADTVEGLKDEFVKTVIHGVDGHKVTVRNVSGSTISIGEVKKILIPFGKGYLPYDSWKSDTSKGFTVAPGSLVFYHELDETPTSTNLATLKNTYPNCDVKSVEVAENNGLALVEIRIEGV